MRRSWEARRASKVEGFSGESILSILSNFLQKIYVQRGLIRNFVVRDLKAPISIFMGFSGA